MRRENGGGEIQPVLKFIQPLKQGRTRVRGHRVCRKAVRGREALRKDLYSKALMNVSVLSADGDQGQSCRRGQHSFKEFCRGRYSAIEKADLLLRFLSALDEAVIPKPAGHANHVHIERLLDHKISLPHQRQKTFPRVPPIVAQRAVDGSVKKLK